MPNQKGAQRKTTNWYVITGGPASGKTTTVNLLTQRGYKTTIEHARHFIDTQRMEGKTVEEIRQNQAAFQAGILDMQIEQEASLSPDDVVFLDRAIPDALAYYRFLDLPEDEKAPERIAECLVQEGVHPRESSHRSRLCAPRRRAGTTEDPSATQCSDRLF